MDTSYTEYSQEDMPNILFDLVATNMVLAISIATFIVIFLIIAFARRR